MRRTLGALLLALGLLAGPAVAQAPPGHRLPEGPPRPVREREIDVQHVKADLRFDMEAEKIEGALAVTFTPLHAGLSAFSLDAAGLEVSKVEMLPAAQALGFELKDRSLRVSLPQRLEPGQVATVRIAYSSHPKVGMYFHPAFAHGPAQAWNYGEGGRHYGWLPLYNDTNDRFTAQLEVTVARPYLALGNGVLQQTRDNADGTRTFRWVQDLPIPNYLLTVDVGEFARVALPDARLGTRTVPLAVWTQRGDEDAVAFTFRDTPRMVEFFSERFGYPYPWAKYDQITLRDFAVGAMETTTLVGFTEAYRRRPGDPVDSGPSFDEAFPTWTTEDTIAHELAHHWFGDLVTCRSLGSIWLNESFASFAHTLWNAHANGEDDLTYQRWRYLNRYLDYVRRTGSVRPLEYLRYKSSDDIYQEETTYVKGALVLQMLRHVVGDADFFRTLGDYLRRNEFGNVDSADLKEAFQKSAGRELGWFFDDWIMGGGGHPSLEVSYRFVPERRQVDLTINQVQADLPFENDFRLPVDVEVLTASGPRTHRVELSGWSTRVALPAEEKPRALVFDKGGWLVADVRFERPLAEVLYLLDHGGLAERLRAARQLARDYGRRGEAAAALGRLLADRKAHWGLRQEAAIDLGTMGGETAALALTTALADADPRVRRAAALALRDVGAGATADAALIKVVNKDTAEDVVAVAARSLGRRHARGARELLLQLLRRDSRWWNAIRLGALLGLSELEDATLVPTLRPYTDARYEHELRLAALEAWMRAAPEDPALPVRLRELTADRNRRLRQDAIEKLGGLHRREDVAFLKELAAAEPDPALAEAARSAAQDIEAFLGGPTHAPSLD